jgi:hypothetical protein
MIHIEKHARTYLTQKGVMSREWAGHQDLYPVFLEQSQISKTMLLRSAIGEMLTHGLDCNCV